MVVICCVNHSDSWQPPWTVARQAPLSTEFSRQEYWSGLPFPSPGDLPNPGIKPGFPTLQADSLLSEPPVKSWDKEVRLEQRNGKAGGGAELGSCLEA